MAADLDTLQRINRELRALSSCSTTVMRATDEPSLLRDVCRIVCDEAGYRMAWVGYAAADEAKTIRPMAWAGVEDGFLAESPPSWDDTEAGRRPSGTAIRTGRTVSFQDLATDPAAAPWREAALRRGYRSSIALPLEDAGRTFGVLCIYAPEPGAFTADEQRLLEALASDLSFGIAVLRGRAELVRAEEERAAHLYFLESMDRVNRAIAGAADLEAMMGAVLDVVLLVFRCDRAFLLHPCDPDAPRWRLPRERCSPDHPRPRELPGEVPMEPHVAGVLRTLLASDAPVRFGPGAPAELPPEALPRYGVRSLLAMAVRPKTGAPWCLGIHQCSHARSWNVHEEWLFQEIGRRLADALGTLLAVTERAGMEAQLRQAQKLEAVGRLAGGVAHDFNNLLTAILGGAQALAEGLPPDHPLRTEASEIEAAARRAALLTRQLLAFGRKQPVEPRVVDVAATVASIERMLRRLIGEDVELTTAVPPGVGRIRVDPVQLEQVLLNLAVNARDAMPRGGRLVIEASDLETPAAEAGAPARWVRLAVRDTGTGMSPEVKAHLFEPFFTTKEAGKGTGLGLATVYGIVRQAGGDVRVRSEPGRGTSFEVLFPRVEPPADAPAPAPPPPPRAARRADGTVLVVEDEPAVRALAVRVLRAAGYGVVEASDAERALRLVVDGQLARVDLLLSDVVMPRLSGPELAERLRAARPDLPVLFASGYLDRVLDVQALGARTGFLAKPFTGGELLRKVRELLERCDAPSGGAGVSAPGAATRPARPGG